MRKIAFIILLPITVVIGCDDQEHQLFCAEGVRQSDGIRVYYSANEAAEQMVLDFAGDQEYHYSPNRPSEYYVLDIYKCSSGFCIENHEVGEQIFTGESYILANGCHSK